MRKKVAKKWVRNKSDEQAVKEGCYWEDAAGWRVVEFFEKYLVHTQGEWAGHAFILLDWQRDDVLRPLYSWKRPDGSRRFRYGYISVPKSNGKSPMLAGQILYGLAADGETAAHIISAGVDRDQARIVFDYAKDMAAASPLASRIETKETKNRLIYPATRSWYQCVSKESEKLDGHSYSMVVIDELHRQKNEKMFQVLRYSGKGRKSPLMVCITTAGVDRESICYKQYSYAKEILNSERVDTSFFSYIREASLDDDLDSVETWKKANPSWGTIIKEDEFRQAYESAKASTTDWNNFLRLRLNVWTDSLTCWIPTDTWKANQIAEPNLTDCLCWAGLDGASVEDTFSLCLLFRLDDGSYYVKPFVWIPEDTARLREETDRIPLLDWKSHGHIRTTEGNRVDYDVIREQINEIGAAYPQLKHIVADPYNVTQLCGQLQQDGFDVSFYRQSMGNMTEPTKEFERLVSTGKLLHGGNPCMANHVANTMIEEDSFENIRPKKAARTKRCDSVIATIQALRLAMLEGSSTNSINEIVWV